MKIGLYFGSFNPIHNGHLIIAEFVLQNADIDQVWFVISPQNPFKKSATLLNEYHRLALVRTAIEGENNLKVSDLEFHLPRPSYTIDTLTYLREKYSQYQFSLIMGADSYQNLPEWKNGQQIIDHYELYVYKRPGYDTPVSTKKNIHFLNSPIIEISSTLIRNMIKSGKSIKGMVPDIVIEEIEKGGYYK